MKKRRPEPDAGSRPSDTFLRFQDTVKTLLAVSKKELDELRAAEWSKRGKGKTRVEERATGHSPP